MSKAHLVEVVMAMRADGYGQAVIANRTGYHVRHIRLICAEFGIGKGRIAYSGYSPPAITPCMPVVLTHGANCVYESELQPSVAGDVAEASA
jgi:hypothetical protein